MTLDGSRTPGFLLSIAALVLCAPPVFAQDMKAWEQGPFQKAAIPCLTSEQSSQFICPIRGSFVGWEAKDVFNPAALVRGDTVFLLYRAQDNIGKPAGTSRIGLAWSTDGAHFQRRPAPVLYPDTDSMKEYEWEGGCEDPRVVQNDSGEYFMTYTAFDSRLARLAVATSYDLIHWKKHGLAFGGASGGRYRDHWSKSGAIVSRMIGGTPRAARINGRYWMYWGEGNIFLATSDDLIHWTPVDGPDGKPAAALSPRPAKFDSRLVEPGPPAMLTDSGIVMIYNSSNDGIHGDPDLPGGTYAAGQALFDKDDPGRCIDRCTANFIHPDQPYERTGQVHDVCFLEGLVFLRGSWLLYYGTADSRIAVATSSREQSPRQ